MSKSLGMKLKNLRDERDLTIRDVSRLTGLGVNTISRWENDKVSPKRRHLSELAAFYGVGVSYFNETEDSLERLHKRVGALENRVQTMEKKFAGGIEIK
jgi:transcriptional regulator with XRE-family HTH domain